MILSKLKPKNRILKFNLSLTARQLTWFLDLRDNFFLYTTASWIQCFINFQAEDGWFSKKATKINHSTSTFSFLVPGFINAALSEEDPLVQLEVDDSRNVLYTRSDKGTIQVFDLGSDGEQLSRIVSLNQQTIVQYASKVALNVDKNNFFPIIGINPITSGESYQLGLVATTASGVRLYFTTADNNTSNLRPHNLTLQHVRLPPGFAASSPAGRPSKVHLSYYQNGEFNFVVYSLKIGSWSAYSE